jgi:glycine rich protein
MLPAAVRRRIYTTTAISSLVGKLGDFVVDTTKKTLVVFDGITPGGIPLSRADHIHPNATNSSDGFMPSADHIFLYAHTHPNATETVPGFMSAADKTNLDSLVSSGGTGGPTPQVSAATPNTLVLRDGSGNFSANIITASLAGNAATVTSGVLNTGAYANPPWIISLAASKLTGTITIPVSSNIPWSQITGAPTIPTNVSQLTNDSRYIIASSTITGASGSVTGQTPSPTPGTVVVRDSNGRTQMVTPLASGDVATKAYVDAAAGGGNNKIVFSIPGSYNWTVPSNLNWIKYVIIGAGGAGSGGFRNSSVNYGGAGGGGGAFAFIQSIPVNPGDVIPIVVGAGGIANLTVPTGTNEVAGTSGGNSSIGTFLIVPGGTAGSPNGGATNSPGGWDGTNNNPYYGLNVLSPGGFGAQAGRSFKIGGGGGAPGYVPVSSPGYVVPPYPLYGQQAAANETGTNVPVAGEPDFLPALMGAGNGGGVRTRIGGSLIVLPGVGGGGAGSTVPGTNSYIAGQNGGNGLVVILW